MEAKTLLAGVADKAVDPPSPGRNDGVRNAAGCTEWSEAIKTARIEIINPACYGNRIVPFNFEKTLVHELLHLKFSFWCQNEDDVGDRVMHQMIDDLARALTEGDSDDEA